MALRGALTHWKTCMLARLLAIPDCCALGIMEALWHVTAAQTPNGAIGRLANVDIANALRWPMDDAERLVQSLLTAELLDPLPNAHRLYIHNWHKKNDNTLDAKLFREGEWYANGARPRGTKLAREEKDRLLERFYTQPPASLFAASAEAAKPEVAAAELPANVLQFVPAPHGAAKRLPEPEPVPVPEPVIPLPPFAKGESRREQRQRMAQALRTPSGKALDSAVEYVSTTCRFTGTSSVRTQTAIWMAIEAECKRVDKPPEVEAMGIAARMVENYTDYVRLKHLLRFAWQPPKFFEGGYWADDRTWPWDQQLIAQQRNATVGVR